MSDSLNVSQRRWLTIVLRDLESSLRKAQAWLALSEERGILYGRRLEVPPESQAVIADTIAAALHEIETLARDFDLVPVVDDLGSRIAAEMNVHVADLADTRAKKLKRYGDVDPQLADVLDPHLDRLTGYASLLARLGRERQQSRV